MSGWIDGEMDRWRDGWVDCQSFDWEEINMNIYGINVTVVFQSN